LHEDAVDEALTQAALQSPMWETRWRWNVQRALAVLRHQGGRRTPPPILRMRAADLLAAVFPAQAGCQDNHGGEMVVLPDHPLVNETTRDCLNDAMDAEGLKAMLRRLHAGEIKSVARETVAPSPFSHAILNANPFAFLDDAPLEERWARQVRTARPGELTLRGGDLRTLDAAAIATVVESVRIGGDGLRDADELHDLLCAPMLLLPRDEWAGFFNTLVAAGRATAVWISMPPAANSELRWAAAEVLPLVRALWPGMRMEPSVELPAALNGEVDPDDAAVKLVRSHVQSAGPTTTAAIAAALLIDAVQVEAALARLELDGIVLQGQFSPGGAEAEWCERRLLQRIHRLTLGRLREDIKPVAPADLVRFLLRWQHVQPGTQLHGAEGLLRVIEQLEGIELPAQAWEREVLPRRIANYDPAWLDELCLSGEVAWGRLSPLPAEGLEPGELPRGAGKVALLLREHAAFLVARADRPAKEWPHLSALARRMAEALECGAAFAADLRAGLGVSAADIEDALWELARAGAITSDGFAGLRALCLPGEGQRRMLRGRWSLISRELGAGAAPDPFCDGSPVDLARVFLRRYGVVARALLSRETGAPAWRVLLDVYRRLEARGEIRGGRFVSGLQGEQFALPEAVEALRALRRGGAGEVEEIEVATTDPLNLVGIITGGPRVPAVRGHVLRYRDGAPVEVSRPLAV
jgi:ATP-dependent Lhr-like helicase